MLTVFCFLCFSYCRVLLVLTPKHRGLALFFSNWFLYFHYQLEITRDDRILFYFRLKKSIQESSLVVIISLWEIRSSKLFGLYFSTLLSNKHVHVMNKALRNLFLWTYQQQNYEHGGAGSQPTDILVNLPWKISFLLGSRPGNDHFI